MIMFCYTKRTNVYLSWLIRVSRNFPVVWTVARRIHATTPWHSASKFESSLNRYNRFVRNNAWNCDRLLDDSLQCSADIIDSDCSEINGKDKFDSWYKGLRAVYSYMCHPMTNNGTRESALHSKYTECFSKWDPCLMYHVQLSTTNKHETTSLCKSRQCAFVYKNWKSHDRMNFGLKRSN